MLNEKLINELYNTYANLCESRQQDIEETPDSFKKGIEGLYKQYIEDKEKGTFKEYAEDWIYSYLCYDC